MSSGFPKKMTKAEKSLEKRQRKESNVLMSSEGELELAQKRIQDQNQALLSTTPSTSANLSTENWDSVSPRKRTASFRKTQSTSPIERKKTNALVNMASDSLSNIVLSVDEKYTDAIVNAILDSLVLTTITIDGQNQIGNLNTHFTQPIFDHDFYRTQKIKMLSLLLSRTGTSNRVSPTAKISTLITHASTNLNTTAGVTMELSGLINAIRNARNAQGDNSNLTIRGFMKKLSTLPILVNAFAALNTNLSQATDQTQADAAYNQSEYFRCPSLYTKLRNKAGLPLNQSHYLIDFLDREFYTIPDAVNRAVESHIADVEARRRRQM